MANAPGVSVNLDTYIEDSSKGVVKMVKLNGVVHYTSRKYNSDTGEPVPNLVPLQREAIAQGLEGAKKTVAAFEKMLADIDAAQEKLAV